MRTNKTGIMTTILTILLGAIVILTVIFHYRWERQIRTSPIVLDRIRYTFQDNPELRPFDDKTSATWASQIPEGWSSVEFQDVHGHKSLKGIGMYHKLHCLSSLRTHVAELLSESVRIRPLDQTEALIQQLHLGHCFDFIRQVSTLVHLPFCGMPSLTVLGHSLYGGPCSGTFECTTGIY
ncbi:hypothetical protein ASPBRDRAFT_281446 [Aspergillus brasiliensis CBS 101740]|uniref:Uncharacterized protein n=1 Tax=Aspergillus brasiliensis (strain CBS 101740 / IMI 381727 / IBT 21946) TaxID=767769 RepID=A0A1L9UD04_ASPBC|nr:hypothetical protein ASPBRDRAFT_281446 [Aspergillus brasiliensis CBS 101740]